jgi:opacity protein-like surface antigen
MERPARADNAAMPSNHRRFGQFLGAGVLAAALLLTTPAPARADITAFLGTANRTASTSALTTSMHGMPGVAVGIGLIAVGFEVEVAAQTEDTVKQVSGLKTGFANVLVQTPTGDTQLYGTVGGGLYQESVGLTTTTDFATNIGGGLKLALTGPIRLRFDYRLINMRGKTTGATVHRFYIGANLKF